MLKTKDNFIANSCRFLIENQVGKQELWDLLIKQIAEKRDKTGHYRGEYWGKIMRGAALICKYTGDDTLYAVLEKTVRDLIGLCTEDGISSYADKCQFTAWDVWCRKYFAVGLEYFYDICRSEELKKEILRVLVVHLTAITRKIGIGEGKMGICDASLDWGGLNSCSILKAYVVAYKLTGEKNLLDFAEYIVSTGGSKDFNFLQAAKKGTLPLCSYLYPKAYESTSFFEGLLEYGMLKGDDEIISACKNYAQSILKEEFTVVGSGGCAVECFNYSVLAQTYPRTKAEQETCVTVSYMLYFEEMYKVTGDKIYLDAMEKSFYNAYLGALNETNPTMTHRLPIDWYSPLVGGKRANILVAGRQFLSDGSFYSCCTAIGPAGCGVFANRSVENQESVLINFYENTTIKAGDIVIKETTDYPFNGDVVLTFSGKKTPLTIRFRLPGWCDNFSLTVKGKAVPVKAENGYVWVSETFESGDEIRFSMEMAYHAEYMAAARFKGGFLYFTKGPIVYAADRRYTGIFRTFPLMHQHKPELDFCYTPVSVRGALDGVEVKYKGKKITLVDYPSAGSTYTERSGLNVFIPYRTPYWGNPVRCFFDRRKKI